MLKVLGLRNDAEDDDVRPAFRRLAKVQTEGLPESRTLVSLYIYIYICTNLFIYVYVYLYIYIYHIVIQPFNGSYMGAMQGGSAVIEGVGSKAVGMQKPWYPAHHRQSIRCEAPLISTPNLNGSGIGLRGEALLLRGGLDKRGISQREGLVQKGNTLRNRLGHGP